MMVSSTQKQTPDPPGQDLDTMPLGWRHWHIWLVSSAGQFLGGAIATLVGIAMPLLQRNSQLHPSTLDLALIGSMVLLGIMAGSMVIGHLSDRYGRLLFFKLCPLLILLSGTGASFAPNIPFLLTALFLIGIGIGGEYALDAAYISETMPKKWRIKMVGAAKAASSAGNVAGALTGVILLTCFPELKIWQELLLFIPCAALVMLLSRMKFAESPRWLLEKGRESEAADALHKLLGPEVELSDLTRSAVTGETGHPSPLDLFRPKHLRKTILTGIPWACEGMAVYGIGIFTPLIILSLGIDHNYLAVHNNFWGQQISAIHSTLFVNIFLILGFLLGLALMSRITHLEMQFSGFLLAAFGLATISLGQTFGAAPALLLTGFILFNVFLNAGPHLTTFILPTELYSVRLRGTGCGFAAALGKVGSVLGTFCFPYLLKQWDITVTLWIMAAAQILGALVTWLLGKPYNRQEEKQETAAREIRNSEHTAASRF